MTATGSDVNGLENTGNLIEVFVPVDSGFSSGGAASDFVFPIRLIWVLFTPLSWWARFYGGVLLPLRDRKRKICGEVPFPCVSMQFPGYYTLAELLRALRLDGPLARQMSIVERHYHVHIKDIESEVLTEAIRMAQIADW